VLIKHRLKGCARRIKAKGLDLQLGAPFTGFAYRVAGTARAPI